MLIDHFPGAGWLGYGAALVGLVFLWAGAIKAGNLRPFINHLHRLRIVRRSLLQPVAIGAVGLELAWGAALVVGPQPEVLYPATLLLLASLAGLTVWSTSSGRVDDCGCYGGQVEVSPAQSVGLNGLYALLIVLAWLSIDPPATTSPWRIWVVALVGAAGAGFAWYGRGYERKHGEPIFGKSPLDVGRAWKGGWARGAKVEDMKGEVLVVYMSTTCPHCQTWGRILNVVHQLPSLPDVVGVISAPDQERAEFAEEHAFRFPVFSIRRGIMDRLTEAVPTSVLVEDGVIRRLWLGSVPEDEFAARFREAAFPEVARRLKSGTPAIDLRWIEDLPDMVRVSVDSLLDAPNFAEELARYARESWRRQRKGGDRRIYQKLAWNARRLDPRNPKVRLATEWAVRGPVNAFHFPMVRDEARNSAYEHALRSVVTPETVVLEIGTGAGVLAMLAARAGAKHVYTCESEPLLVDIANETLVRNGLADRVTVIPKHSGQLVVGGDLPDLPDLLLSDHIAAHVIDYGAVPMVRSAKESLLSPGGIVMPSMAGLSGVLVGGEPWGRQVRAGLANDLDLSALNLYSPPQSFQDSMDCDLDDAMSADMEIFRIDFAGEIEYPERERTVVARARRDGVVEGFLHWVWVRLTPEIGYDVRPPSRKFRSPVLHWFPAPIEVREGDEVQLTVQHDESTVRVYPS